jgi:hypothetical protein
MQVLGSSPGGRTTSRRTFAYDKGAGQKVPAAIEGYSIIQTSMKIHSPGDSSAASMTAPSLDSGTDVMVANSPDRSLLVLLTTS